MGAGKISLFEAARLHQRHGNGIAQNKRVQRRSGRRKVQRAGLAVDRDIEGDLRGFRQAALCRRGHRDNPGLKPLEGGQKPDNLFGLAGIGDQDHHVAAPYHAKIAMNGLGRMKEQRRRARRCQCRRNLAADQPRLAHAADNDMSTCLHHQINGRRERRAERRIKTGDSAAIGGEEAACRANGGRAAAIL